MKTKNSREATPENEASRLFKEFLLKHFTNVPIKGSDKVYHTSLELMYTMREQIPELTVGEVTKVMGSLDFETASFDAFPVWVMYRIDGERELFEYFGFTVGGV